MLVDRMVGWLNGLDAWMLGMMLRWMVRWLDAWMVMSIQMDIGKN